jgi:D-serine deaminase-like pyridoxal phosphate-dependent protein
MSRFGLTLKLTSVLSYSRLQVAAGNVRGITYATAAEAMLLAPQGFRDILIANEIVFFANTVRMAESTRIADCLTVAIDSMEEQYARK